VSCIFFNKKMRFEKISEKVKYGKRKNTHFYRLRKSIYIEIYVCIYGAIIGKCASFTINFSLQTHISRILKNTCKNCTSIHPSLIAN